MLLLERGGRENSFIFSSLRRKRRTRRVPVKRVGVRHRIGGLNT